MTTALLSFFNHYLALQQIFGLVDFDEEGYPIEQEAWDEDDDEFGDDFGDDSFDDEDDDDDDSYEDNDGQQWE